ncbi:MAG: hypothetical protein E6G60_08980 [Actinobacteria bacterium]|nr:MAG: hypothetical protein E6G60_08980 [Actinomycetota bacterium]
MNGSARDAASEPVVPEVVRSPGSEDVPVQGPPLTPLSPTESLLGALLGAVPEVAQHVVRAAQELLLAAKALVDAAEYAVEEQRDARGRLAADVDTTNVRRLERFE